MSRQEYKKYICQHIRWELIIPMKPPKLIDDEAEEDEESVELNQEDDPDTFTGQGPIENLDDENLKKKDDENLEKDGQEEENEEDDDFINDDDENGSGSDDNDDSVDNFDEEESNVDKIEETNEETAEVTNKRDSQKSPAPSPKPKSIFFFPPLFFINFYLRVRSATG